MKKETRPILLKEEFTPTEFSVGGIDFIECNYDSEFTVRQDKTARKVILEIAKLKDLKTDENGETNIPLTELMDILDEIEILSVCVKRKGTVWSVEQYELNKELFYDSPQIKETAVIVKNFFVSMPRITERGFQTLSALMEEK